MATPFTEGLATAEIDRLLDENGAFGVRGSDEEDAFPMSFMSNDHITWAVERERGMSFDLTALCDVEDKIDEQPETKREIKMEAGADEASSVMEENRGSGHSPSPFRRSVPAKRLLPSLFKLGDSASKKACRVPAPCPKRAHTRSQAANRSPRPISPPTPAPPEPIRVRQSTSRKQDSNSSGKGRLKAVGINTAALMAELGLVDRRNRCSRGGGQSSYRVGAYTLEQRAAIVAKFHAKRGRRIWRKKIKYDCRKKLADKRPRLKGRFVTQEELEGFDQATLAKVTGLGSCESSSDPEDSDGSEGYERPAYTACRYRGTGRYGTRQEFSRRQAVPAEPTPAKGDLKAQLLPSSSNACGKEADNVHGEVKVEEELSTTSQATSEVDESLGEDTVVEIETPRLEVRVAQPVAVQEVAKDEDFDVADMFDMDGSTEGHQDSSSFAVVKDEQQDFHDFIPGFFVDDVLSQSPVLSTGVVVS